MIEIIENTAGFERLRDEWNTLLRASSSDCFFLTWEWLYAWWKHLGGNRRLFVLTVRADGELLAIAPLAKRPLLRSPLPPSEILEFLGTGTAGSDYLDFIVRAGKEEEVLPVLAQQLAREKSPLLLRRIRENTCLAAALRDCCKGRGWRSWSTQTEICPVIKLGGHTWDSYLATLGPEHRYNVRRKLKNLEKRFDARLEMASSEPERKAALATLLSLHSMRWSERGGSDAFFTPEHIAFHEELTALALQQGWLRLFTLRLDGKPAASLYGFHYGKVFSFYQSGFDPGYASVSVGLVIMGLAIQQAIGEGSEEYDLLHGTEPYKFHWARDQRELGTLELYPPGTAGLVWKWLRASMRTAKQVARNVLPRSVSRRIVAMRRSKTGKELHAARSHEDGQFSRLTLDRH